MRYTSPVFLLLAIVPDTYQSWVKFGVWALPLFVFFVAVTPVYGDPFAGVPSRDLAALRLLQLFLLVSVFIIVYNRWRHYRTQ